MKDNSFDSNLLFFYFRSYACFVCFSPPEKQKLTLCVSVLLKGKLVETTYKLLNAHIIFQIRLPRQYIPSQQKEITGLQIYLFYNFRLCQVICEKLFHNVKTMAPPRSYNLVEGRQPRPRVERERSF
jgi:hypothetical protein